MFSKEARKTKAPLDKVSREAFQKMCVGVAGFEPATSCSQSRRDDRATLHPETKFVFRKRPSRLRAGRDDRATLDPYISISQLSNDDRVEFILIATSVLHPEKFVSHFVQCECKCIKR